MHFTEFIAGRVHCIVNKTGLTGNYSSLLGMEFLRHVNKLFVAITLETPHGAMPSEM